MPFAMSYGPCWSVAPTENAMRWKGGSAPLPLYLISRIVTG